MKKYLWIGVAALIILAGEWYYFSQPKQAEGEPIKIGAVLPLTGPTAVYGEALRNGMELAKKELADNSIIVELFYEDSEGQAAKGVSAYRTLVDVRGVDIVVSAFSRVSVPLVLLADADKIPLIMTVVSATGIPAQSPYAFRFYNTAAQYVEPYFANNLTADNYESLGVLYINDEFGVSVRDAVRDEAQKAGVSIVAEEAFIPGASDFRTQIANLKSARPAGILFVAFAPGEATNFITQARELGVDQDLFDGSSILSSATVRSDLGKSVERAFTTVFPFDLAKTGEDFRVKYETAHDKQPFFVAPFGYDVVSFIADISDGKQVSGDEFAERVGRRDSAASINGTLKIDSTGEINPALFVAEIKNGELVEVK